MATMNNTEICKLIASRFPLGSNNEYYVFDGRGEYAIYAKETAKGFSSAIVNGKYYSKMTAAEKKEAVEFVRTAPVELVARKVSQYERETYFLAGAWDEYCEKDRGQHWYESKKASFLSATPVAPLSEQTEEGATEVYQVVFTSGRKQEVIFTTAPFNPEDGQADWDAFKAATKAKNAYCMKRVGEGCSFDLAGNCRYDAKHIGQVEVIRCEL